MAIETIGLRRPLESDIVHIDVGVCITVVNPALRFGNDVRPIKALAQRAIRKNGYTILWTTSAWDSDDLVTSGLAGCFCDLLGRQFTDDLERIRENRVAGGV